MSAPAPAPAAVTAAPDGFALPTLIFITLSTITIVGHLIYILKGQPDDAKYKLTTRVIVIEVILAFIGSALYYLLCANGYTAVAWLLLILPLIGAIYSFTASLVNAWGVQIAGGNTTTAAVVQVAEQANTPSTAAASTAKSS